MHVPTVYRCSNTYYLAPHYGNFLIRVVSTHQLILLTAEIDFLFSTNSLMWIMYFTLFSYYLAHELQFVQEIIDMCDYAVGLSRQLNGSIIPSEREMTISFC